MTESYADLLKKSLVATSRLKASAQSLKTKIVSGSVESSHVFNFYESLQSVWDLAGPLVVHPDINALAEAHIISPPSDTAAMIAAGHTAGEACALWIEANLPMDEDDNLLGFKLDAPTNKLIYPTYTGTDLAGLSALLDTLIASLE